MVNVIHGFLVSFSYTGGGTRAFFPAKLILLDSNYIIHSVMFRLKVSIEFQKRNCRQLEITKIHQKMPTIVSFVCNQTSERSYSAWENERMYALLVRRKTNERWHEKTKERTSVSVKHLKCIMCCWFV